MARLCAGAAAPQVGRQRHTRPPARLRRERSNTRAGSSALPLSGPAPAWHSGCSGHHGRNPERSHRVNENDHPKGALLFMLVYLGLLAFMWTNLYLKLWTR